MIVYISIGNSDDKLSQARWADFAEAVDALFDLDMNSPIEQRHGFWASLPVSAWQNACWCVEFANEQDAEAAKRELRLIAAEFDQDAIAWAVAETEFIGPAVEP